MILDYWEDFPDLMTLCFSKNGYPPTNDYNLPRETIAEAFCSAYIGPTLPDLNDASSPNPSYAVTAA